MPTPTRPLYHPSLWPSWLLLGLLKLLTLLPFTTQLALGRLLGRIFMVVGRRRRHIADVNLRLCFPELDEAGHRRLLRETFEAQGMGLMETAAAWLMAPGRLLPRVTLEGVEYLEQARREGRAALMLGAHYTTLDIAGTLLGNFAEFDVIYRRQKNPVIEYMMTQGRRHYLKGGRTIAQDDMRGVYRSLAQKRALWYPPDQDYGAKHSVFVPFFGVPAAVIKAPTRMASKSDAVVLACSYHRTPDARYQLAIYPLEGFTGEDFEADATAFNRQLEEQLRRYPEQYMWVHRRFKSRPPGAAKVY